MGPAAVDLAPPRARTDEQPIAALPEERRPTFLRWIVPFVTPAERAAILTELYQSAPQETFGGILTALKPRLSEQDWSKLMAALGPLQA